MGLCGCESILFGKSTIAFCTSSMFFWRRSLLFVLQYGASVKKLILHLGAHRCGSTAIQTMLSRGRDSLAKDNVGVCLREDMARGECDLRRLHRYRSFDPLAVMKLKRLAKQIKRQPYDVFVVSDENIMGTMPGVLGSQFYLYFPRLMNGILKLQQYLRGDYSVHPRILVRRQDHYIESVYAFRVSRGLQLDFDEFLAGIKMQSLSWLQLGKVLQQTSGVLSPQISVLESWLKETAMRDAERFLCLPEAQEAATSRLSGNMRRNNSELRLILALNRAGIDLELAKSANVFSYPVRADTDADIERATYLLKDSVTPRQLKTLERSFSHAVKLGFNQPERGVFMKLYERENTQFFDLDIVAAGPSVWR